MGVFSSNQSYFTQNRQLSWKPFSVAMRKKIKKKKKLKLKPHKDRSLKEVFDYSTVTPFDIQQNNADNLQK